MSFAVVVLLPNGRRQTVKSTPNSSILQVLETVCQKQGLSCDEYDLKHYKTVLDLSNTIRFSNLPNNAQLELIKAVKSRNEEKVNVGLQLESGERLVDDFPSSVSLYDVIQHWDITKAMLLSATTEENLIPVCIYMRNEIAGETALAATTLRSLGLFRGRVMIRLFYRSAGILNQQAHVELLLPKISKPPAEEMEDEPKNQDFNPEPRQASSQEQQEVPAANSVGEINSCSLSPTSSRKRRNLSGGSNDNRQISQGVFMKRTTQDDMLHVSLCTTGNNRPLQRNPRQRVGDQSGRSLALERPSDENVILLGARQALLFSLDAVHSDSQEDLPDEFYNLTLDDVKFLMADLRRKREELENASLQTLTSREDEMRKKMEKYQQTVIRILFPDRLVLQGLFSLTDTIYDVMDFVGAYLIEEVREFHLFTAPPKKILEPTQYLWQQSLFPKALVYFGSDSSPPHPLREDLRLQLSSPTAANHAAMVNPRHAATINDRNNNQEMVE